jgi:hypothetical protein
MQDAVDSPEWRQFRASGPLQSRSGVLAGSGSVRATVIQIGTRRSGNSASCCAFSAGLHNRPAAGILVSKLGGAHRARLWTSLQVSRNCLARRDIECRGWAAFIPASGDTFRVSVWRRATGDFSVLNGSQPEVENAQNLWTAAADLSQASNSSPALVIQRRWARLWRQPVELCYMAGGCVRLLHLQSADEHSKHCIG